MYVVPIDILAQIYYNKTIARGNAPKDQAKAVEPIGSARQELDRIEGTQ